jgi:hypothetical protein
MTKPSRGAGGDDGARVAWRHPGSKRTRLWCLRCVLRDRVCDPPGLSCGAIGAKIDVYALISPRDAALIEHPDQYPSYRRENDISKECGTSLFINI